MKVRIRFVPGSGYFRLDTATFGAVDYRSGIPRDVPDAQGRSGPMPIAFGPYPTLDEAFGAFRWRGFQNAPTP